MIMNTQFPQLKIQISAKAHRKIYRLLWNLLDVTLVSSVHPANFVSTSADQWVVYNPTLAGQLYNKNINYHCYEIGKFVIRSANLLNNQQIKLHRWGNTHTKHISITVEMQKYCGLNVCVRQSNIWSMCHWNVQNHVYYYVSILCILDPVLS